MNCLITDGKNKEPAPLNDVGSYYSFSAIAVVTIQFSFS